MSSDLAWCWRKNSRKAALAAAEAFCSCFAEREIQCQCCAPKTRPYPYGATWWSTACRMSTWNGEFTEIFLNTVVAHKYCRFADLKIMQNGTYNSGVVRPIGSKIRTKVNVVLAMVDFCQHGWFSRTWSHMICGILNNTCRYIPTSHIPSQLSMLLVADMNVAFMEL